MPADSRIRAAIVGTGTIARIGHLPAIRELADQVDLVAAVDLQRGPLDAFADEAGVARRYTSLTAMLAAEAPDLVVVATPPVVHREQVAEVLEAGAWVWCEKPPALSLAEHDTMCAAEREGGPYAAIVFQLRFGPGARHYRALLQDGRLGRPLAAMCQTTWFRDDAYFAPEWRGHYRGDGGPSMSMGIHQIDLMLAMLGPWQEVSAFAATTSRHIQTDDVSVAVVRFECGALGSIVTSAVSAHSVSRLRVDTELATVGLTHLYRYTNADWTCTAAPGVLPETVAGWANHRPDETTDHTPQLRDLISDLRAGRRPETSGDGGRSALELITALYKSAFTGEVVKRGEIGPADPYYYGLEGRPTT